LYAWVVRLVVVRAASNSTEPNSFNLFAQAQFSGPVHEAGLSFRVPDPPQGPLGHDVTLIILMLSSGSNTYSEASLAWTSHGCRVQCQWEANRRSGHGPEVQCQSGDVITLSMKLPDCSITNSRSGRTTSFDVVNREHQLSRIQFATTVYPFDCRRSLPGGHGFGMDEVTVNGGFASWELHSSSCSVHVSQPAQARLNFTWT